MLPLISFETGRRSPTQSSVQDHSLVCASKWKSGSIRNRNHGREAHTRGEESERTYTRAPPTARRESFCPLDKDLSWKSGYRTSSGFGPISLVRFPRLPGSKITAPVLGWVE